MPLVNLYGGDKDAYNRAIFEGLKKSRTGSALLSFLTKAGRDYDSVILERGETFGQMAIAGESNPEAVIAKTCFEKLSGKSEFERPTVFWNPTYEFEYYGDVVGYDDTIGKELSTGSATPKGDGYKAVGYLHKEPSGKLLMGKPHVNTYRVLRLTKGKFPPWITLFHELGHVKQLYEGGGIAEWAPRLNSAGIDLIEADNLKDHENPICKDAGIMVREKYKHFGAHMETTIAAYRNSDSKRHALKLASTTEERRTMEEELANEAKKPGSKISIM